MQGNVGNLAVNHKKTVPGYKKYVWLRKYAITNIITLKNLINKYQVAYDIIDQIFVVHKEDEEKPNMKLKWMNQGLIVIIQTIMQWY